MKAHPPKFYTTLKVEAIAGTPLHVIAVEVKK